MHLDNKRLESIQRFKTILKNKINTETDFKELELYKQKLKEFSNEEKRILERLNVK